VAAERAFGALDAARVDAAADAALQAALAAGLDTLAPSFRRRVVDASGQPVMQATALARAGALPPGATARVALLLLLACPSLRDPGWHALLSRLLRVLEGVGAPEARVAALALRALPRHRFAALLDVRFRTRVALRMHALPSACAAD
jgi:hypothetical protein